MNQRISTLLGAALFWAGLNLPASAQTARTTASGTWSDGNWTAGLPTSSVDAHVGTTVIAGAVTTAVVTVSDTETAQRVWVGDGSGSANGTGTWNIVSGAAFTTTLGQLLGGGTANSVGTVTQTGGTNTLTSGDMNVGLDGTGTYSLSGSSSLLSVGGNTYLGENAGGVGTFLQNAGTLAAGTGLHVGFNATSTGTFTLSGSGHVLTGSADTLVAENGTGNFVQSGGTLTVRSGTVLHIAANVGSRGTYTLSGGQLESGGGSSGLFVGEAGTGTFVQTGGTNTVSGGGNPFGFLYLGGGTNSASKGTGVYLLSGGVLNVARAPRIGWAGVGTFTQSGGTFNAMTAAGGNDFNLGAMSGSTGTYNLVGGTLVITKSSSSQIGIGNFNSPGDTSTGYLNLGDASGTGTLTFSGSGNAVNVRVRATAASTGTLRGWTQDAAGNRFSLDGILYNAGRVIADGYGTERTLNLSSMSAAVVPTTGADGSTFTPNTTSNGWYAVNKGKLVLPKIGISTGSLVTSNWGEVATSSTLAMVNSARLALNNVTVAGTLDVSLLSPDRSDVPDGGRLLDPLGVWDITNTFTFATGTLTLRYDNGLAASLGVPESNLKLFHYVGGTWVNVTASLDTVNHTITSQSLTSFSPFAIVLDVVPEPSTVLLWAAGGVVVLARRRLGKGGR